MKYASRGPAGFAFYRVRPARVIFRVTLISYAKLQRNEIYV
jgi:hypothetical protein